MSSWPEPSVALQGAQEELRVPQVVFSALSLGFPLLTCSHFPVCFRCGLLKEALLDFSDTTSGSPSLSPHSSLSSSIAPASPGDGLKRPLPPSSDCLSCSLHVTRTPVAAPGTMWQKHSEASLGHCPTPAVRPAHARMLCSTHGVHLHLGCRDQHAPRFPDEQTEVGTGEALA